MLLNGSRAASRGAATGSGLAVVLAGLTVVGVGATSTVMAATAPKKNAITVVTPSPAIRVGRAFTAEAYARFDPRTHRPPRDYLKASLYQRRGTTACPSRLPENSKAWERVAGTDYWPGDSPRVQFGSSVTLVDRASHRFCAYVYVERSGSSLTSPSTFVVKAHASKILRAR